MKKIYFIIYILLQIGLPVQAQDKQGTIKGTITAEGKPVEYATYGLVGTTKGGIADEQGNFSIANISPGSYTLSFSALGYEKQIKKITVKGAETVFLPIRLRRSLSQLGEVVITGTMKETFTTLSPIKVEVFTPVLFKKNPTASIFESLQLVNGVQPQLNCNVCSTGDIHINGMEGPYTMVTIDGMPIVSGLSSVYGLSGIPNSLIQRVEVVKGPASTLYGSEAVGGLINIITKNPPDAPLLAADVYSTSQKEINTDVGLKATLGQAHTLLGVNYFNFNNRLDVNQDNFTDVTLQNRVSVFNKWSFTRKENRLANLAGRYIYEDRFGGEMQWTPAFRGGDSIYGESIYTKRYELIGAYQLPVTNQKLTLQFSYNRHHQNSVYGTTLFKANQQVAFAQLLWDKQIGTRHDFIFGLPFRYTYYDDNTPGTGQPEQGNKPQHIYLPGLFAQDEVKLSEKLTTLAGVRYDYNSDHGSILSPRLSFKYAPDTKNIFRLSGGNGYRVVNLFTEDHAALSGAREVIIKNELKPERSNNLNVNYQHFFDFNSGFAELDGSIFYTHFSNKITADFLTNDQQIIYDNAKGYAISRGLTLNSRFTFTFPLKVNLGATFMNVYQVEKELNTKSRKVPQLYAPPVSGTFDITYTFRTLGLSLDYTGRVNGPMPLPVVANDYRPATSPWFSIQNIQLTKSFKGGLEIYAGLKNILNFIPQDPILRSFDPFDKYVTIDNPHNYTFDPSYIFAPIQGIRGFAGLRLTLPGK